MESSTGFVRPRGYYSASWESLWSYHESVDTEKNLEDAIEAAPQLLFERPVTLLTRQHLVYTGSSRERHIVDLVFADEAANELILVELKRVKLAREHEDQLRRYLDHAGESPLLRACIQAGARLRGVLATVTECSYQPKGKDISVRIVDRERTAAVLKRLRAERQETNQP